MKQKLLITLMLAVALVWGGSAFGQTTASYDFSEAGAVTGLNVASPGVALDANIGFGSFKNSSSTNPAIYSGQLRLYQNATKGGSIKVYASNSVTITGVVVHASGTTGPAAYSIDGVGSTAISISGGAYTMSGLSATSEVEFWCTGSSSGTRIYVDDFEVTYVTGGNIPPSITNISHLPASPNSSQTVSVSADITDSDGTIAGAELHWGTVSGSLTNSIDMSVSSGNTYTSDSDIPAQADGATVYYEIYALDDEAGETTSPEQNYTVTDPTPTITLSETSLTGFTYVEGNGPSVEQSFSTEGSNLTDDITITPPTHYEISLDNTTYQSTAIALDGSSGSVATTTIYVRLLAGLSAGDYNSEDIVASSTDATSQTITCSGSVYEQIDWANLQWPGTGTIARYDDYNVYAQVYESGVTDSPGQGAGITVWIGYSTSDTDPSTWTDWVEATYNTDSDNGNNDEYMANIGASITTVGTYYYASRFQLGTAPYVYGGFDGGFWDGTNNVSGVLTVNALPQIEWANLQWPGSGTIDVGGSFDVYARVFKSGITEAEGQGAGITAWIGYSTTDTDPSTWSSSSWITASFNGDAGNNDEYVANISASLPSGTYYYASRFQLGAADYVYGGFSASGGGFWEEGVNISGVLTINVSEPSSHATSFTATANSSSKITVSWTDAVPFVEGYLIKGSSVSYADIADPVDGAEESDGFLVQNVGPGIETFQFSGLTESTDYYFKIYPYNGTGAAINYKVDGSVPEATATTPATPFIIINEVDADTPGIDDAEFIELYDGGVGNTNLSGLVVVLYNGSDDQSYLPVIDLDGYTTDANGYFVIGSTGMGTDIEISPGSSGWLQNGADAVALYTGVGTDFPNDTPVTTTNLLDALVYDTDDGDDTGLLILLNSGQPQINEAENSNKDYFSMQRLPNGTGGERNTSTYNTTLPTPGALNEFGTITWTGTTDNSWSDITNWSVDIEPGVTINVTIPTGLNNYPTLSAPGYCNNLTIESDENGDASILGDENLTVNGSISVERYITGGVWHDLSASTQGQTVNNLFFNHDPEVWLNTYNESTNGRDPIIDLDDALPSGAGFEIWVATGNNVTVSYDGPLKTTDVTPALSYTVGTPQTDYGFNLIGNPFASPLDWDIGTWNLVDIDAVIYVWDQVAGSYKESVGGNGSLTDGIIPMGQGFFVQATSSSASITIPMDARVHSSQSYYKGATNVADHMWIKAIKGEKNDQLTVVFAEDATEEYDNGRDARKMLAFNGNAPQIYAVEQDDKFGVDGLPSLTEAGRTVNVMYHIGESGEQQLLANLESLPDAKVLLEDLQTGIVQDLNENPEYIFEGQQNDDPNRFTLYFNPTPTTINNLGLNTDIRVYAYNNEVYIKSDGTGMNSTKRVMIYDMFGRIIMDENIAPSSLSIIPVDIHNAPVIVKVISSGTVVTTKVVIN